jgi:hypothetical protein
MLAPGARDAPKFTSKKPEELLRFMRMMEDLWREAGVTDDEAKKEAIGKYADQASEEEWSALETFEKGRSWEEFKAEIIENYPEAAAAERGTPARMKLLCQGTTPIELGDLPALYAFRRAFMVEAKKLSKPPAAMSNRELVELFLCCLASSMRATVLQYLGNTAPASSSKGKAPADGGEAANKTKGRRPEDKYDLDDVSEAAIRVSENSQGMFHLMRGASTEPTGDRGVFLFNQPTQGATNLSQKFEELEGAQAQEKDRLDSVNKTLDSRFSELESMMKKLLAQTESSQAEKSVNKDGAMVNTSTSTTGASGAAPRWGKPMANEECYACGTMGHFQADCEYLKAQVSAGNLKYNPEGKLRMRDGALIPAFPKGACLRERLDKYLARRSAQLFQGDFDEEDDYKLPTTTRGIYQLLNNAEDPERRRARLERELDMREREEALELRKIKLEREEKKLAETSNKKTRAAHVQDLLEQLNEEELASLKVARSGFP